jgi:Transposase DDE domain group 1
VTSLAAAATDARNHTRTSTCARGEVENRIKEQQLDLFADRTSAATMRANQLRLWFASFAYVLLEALRRIGLRHTQFATATCGTIRLKLLKIGPRCAKACAGSRSPWPQPALTRPSTAWPTSICSAPPPSERAGMPEPAPHRTPAADRPEIRRRRRPRSPCPTAAPPPLELPISLPGVESRRGAVAEAAGGCWRSFGSAAAVRLTLAPVPPPRSSNRTCGLPASGFPTGFIARHTAVVPSARA